MAETLGGIGGRTAQQGYATNGTSPDNIRQQYTGYERDDESGLEYAQARYYNSAHGRFTSVDPLTASASIKDPQTFNRYSYVLNSPYKFTDPLGLLPLTSAGACGQWCQNSGGYVDGSAFRGRDASFDWAREYFGEVAGYDLNQPDGSILANGEIIQNSDSSQVTVEETVNSPITASSENGTRSSQPGLEDILNTINQKFGIGGRPPDMVNAVVIEEINGLVGSLTTTVLEIYRVAQKTMLLKDTNPNKAQKLFKGLLAKINKDAKYIGQRFDSPRYMKVLTSVGNIRERRLSSVSLESFAKTVFQLAVSAGANQANRERFVFTE